MGALPRLATCLIFAALWSAGAVLAQPPATEDMWYVTASSGLRVRDLSGNPVGRIDWGDPACSQAELVSTGRRDTVENLPGEWVRFVLHGQDVQVFDAYLWCSELPTPDSDWSEYVQATMDGRNLLELERCFRETDGASSETSMALFSGVTPGQAHQFLRMIIQQWVGDATENMWPETRVAWDAMMTGAWDPANPLEFTLPVEGGAVSWMLQYDAERRTARIQFSMGSC